MSNVVSQNIKKIEENLMNVKCLMSNNINKIEENLNVEARDSKYEENLRKSEFRMSYLELEENLKGWL